jgi:hypothetical protein
VSELSHTRAEHPSPQGFGGIGVEYRRASSELVATERRSEHGKTARVRKWTEVPDGVSESVGAGRCWSSPLRR